MLQAARKRGESLWDAHVASDRQEAEMIQMAGFSSRVIRLAGAVAHGSLKETEKVSGKLKLSDEDVAFLIIHYSDDISRLDKWVEPAEIVEGQKINELDRRMIQNENNPYYQELNEEGRKHFGGETTYQAQRRIGHLVEDRLATLLSQKSGESIDPKDLPEIIDNLVRAKIEETPLT